MWLSAETKGHNVVPISLPVDPEALCRHAARCWRTTELCAATRGETRKTTTPEATARIVDVLGNINGATWHTALARFCLPASAVKLHLVNCVCQQRLIAAENVTQL